MGAGSWDLIAGVGAGGLLLLVVANVTRTVLCIAFVLLMCRNQKRATGQWPTLGEATNSLTRLLGTFRNRPLG
nr:hypothetical protein [Kibdelosporangium sp. MJ126-NF4]CEL14042.1 hypothetical protein [Kibdelosporangium sp. MJ126-NF4]CTQ88408.1 hypothetical protein [Kibdelosporangium sp. MJ126-NF4]